MRKNSPRKWLHAILDLLPVLILPIFALAVRSENNFQPIEVTAQKYKIVDFNQVFKGYNHDSGDISLTYNNNQGYFIDGNNTNSYSYLYLPIQDIYFNQNHKYYFKNFDLSSFIDNGTWQVTLHCPQFTSSTNYYSSDIIEPISTGTFPIYLQVAPNVVFDNYNFGLNIIDLTQMFGLGNEPTMIQFDTWYTNSFYEYTTSRKELLNNGTTTYSDTDIGSQMVYTLYNATDKYFNMNSVFNLNSVWSWIQLNIFNGNTPLVAYVIWQVIIYEFIVDILFIFYSFFMFLIDFCEYLLEKPFNKINRGK